jgi:PPOX class probable F420-dependent enzyme
MLPALIPDSHKDLLDKPVYVVVTTLMGDGQPQSTVVWFDYEGEYLRLNTARGRQKEKNLARDKRVSVMFVDPQNPFRWMEIRGIVGEPTEDGAVDHIHKLSMKYTGKRYYGDFAPAERQSQETRIMYKIQPTKVLVSH